MVPRLRCSMNGPSSAPLQHRFDRHVERVGEAPDRRQRRIGLVALDLRDDRLGDARMLRQVGERQSIALAQPEHGLSELVGQRSRASLENLRPVLAFNAHRALLLVAAIIDGFVRNIERRRSPGHDRPVTGGAPSLCPSSDRCAEDPRNFDECRTLTRRPNCALVRVTELMNPSYSKSEGKNCTTHGNIRAVRRDIRLDTTASLIK